MKSTVILLILSAISQSLNLTLDEDGYPDVQDLFQVLPLPKAGRRSPEELNSFNFDIERIDINKFKKKMEMFAMTLSKNATLPDTRRQRLPLFDSNGVAIENWVMLRAFRWILHAKICDMMLQIIYMARHQIHSLESSKFFSITDTGYRIAFVYRRLRRIWRQMMNIYTYLQMTIWAGNRYDLINHFEKPTEEILMAHLRVIKLHTDFLNLWWVLIKVDGKYKERLITTTKKKRTTTPMPTELTGAEGTASEAQH